MGGSAAVLPAQGGGASSSVSVLGGVAAAGSYVAGGIKHTSAALVSFVTPKPTIIPAEDPTTLAGNPTKPTPKLHVALAEMHEKSGNFAKVREHYEAALKEEPHNLRGLLGYAHLLDRQQKFNEAIAEYRLACKYHPNEAKAYNDLALCYDRHQKFDDAVQSLSKAVALEPRRKLYRNNLAVILIKMGRRDEVLAQLTAVHGPAVAHYNLGSLYFRQGKQSEAAAEFAEAARIEPGFTAARQWSEQIAAAGKGPVGHGFAPNAGEPVARVAGVYPGVLDRRRPCGTHSHDGRLPDEECRTGQLYTVSRFAPRPAQCRRHRYLATGVRRARLTKAIPKEPISPARCRQSVPSTTRPAIDRDFTPVDPLDRGSLRGGACPPKQKRHPCV